MSDSPVSSTSTVSHIDNLNARPIRLYRLCIVKGYTLKSCPSPTEPVTKPQIQPHTQHSDAPPPTAFLLVEAPSTELRSPATPSAGGSRALPEPRLAGVAPPSVGLPSRAPRRSRALPEWRLAGVALRQSRAALVVPRRSHALPEWRLAGAAPR